MTFCQMQFSHYDPVPGNLARTLFVGVLKADRNHRGLSDLRNSITAARGVVPLRFIGRPLLMRSSSQFHLMIDKFHFMTDKFHLMPEPTGNSRAEISHVQTLAE